jgi:serine/threonine protein kinase
MIGKTLAHYEITAQLGKGGMGEVYRAKDQRLGREVAIKVLPEEFARDTDRVARFQREAKLLASLNHPNIAAIYGLEVSDETHFLVLELVEGETLADRIKKGPIPVEESLKLALQIAQALESAHEKGVIHRDLKPANIKVTPEGEVKVLDFGLAKGFTREQERMNLSDSPTLSEAATIQGIILGTAAYMSPEQARGKPADKRADIWAFGCVLYEMLTGRRLFRGESVTDVLAGIVSSEPDFNGLAAAVPSSIVRLLRRSLNKDRSRRLASMGDACLEIEESMEGQDVPSEAPVRGARPRMAWRWATACFVSGLLMGALIVAAWIIWSSGYVPPPRQTRLVIAPPPEAPPFSDSIGSDLAVSPDGRYMAYLGIPGSSPQLFLRSLDRIDARALAGTEGARQPFFSPDGQWIGFWLPGKNELCKVSVEGGPIIPISKTPSGNLYGASWGPEGRIVFASAGLYSVSDTGGDPAPVSAPAADIGEVEHRWPDILPGGRAVLYTVWTGNTDRSQVAVRQLDGGPQKILLEGASYARYVQTGHLVYSQNGSLMAATFDPRTLRVGEKRVALQETVDTSVSGAADFALTTDGTLIMAPATAETRRRLVWTDRNGRSTLLLEAADDYWLPRLSPDGSRLAVGIGSDLWVIALNRLTRTRVTFGTSSTLFPYTWSADGLHITFSKVESKVGLDLYEASSDGSGQPQLLCAGEHRQWGTSWSPDGRALVFYEQHPTTLRDIWILLRGGERKPLLVTQYQERAPRFSPDGRWLAYVSNDSGRDEVFVRPFPGPGARITVSTAGGSEPVWTTNGSEIFYRNGDQMMAAPVQMKPSFAIGRATKLFTGNYERDRGSGAANANYDVTTDGQRFVMIEPPAASSHFVVVLNWFEELKQRVPAK